MANEFVRGGNIDIRPDLKVGAQSLALTLSAGVGSVPIPDDASIVGVKPVSSETIRVGLEAPEANGAATGTATKCALFSSADNNTFDNFLVMPRGNGGEYAALNAWSA